MKGLKYQLKSILKDKFCLMTFLLPVAAAALLSLAGSIDLSPLGELRFGIQKNALPPQAAAWLERYGSVTVCETREELIAAVNEPSTNIIGIEADKKGIKTLISGDELDIYRQTAETLPFLYEQQENAGQAEVLILDRPDILEGYQDIFVLAVLITAMFMGCTFNAVNIISEKENGVIFVNEILPMTPGQYIAQKVAAGFLGGCLSSVITACISLGLLQTAAGGVLILIVLSSFVAAMVGLFIGRLSDGLMVGILYLKLVMLLFIAVPILCTLLGVSGPLSALCSLVPSWPAFEGIQAMSAGNAGTAMKDIGILAAHCIAWPALYVLFSARQKKTGNSIIGAAP